MLQHLGSMNRSAQVVNLDPAAEHFDYPVMAGEYIMFRLQSHYIYLYKVAPYNPQQGYKKVSRD